MRNLWYTVNARCNWCRFCDRRWSLRVVYANHRYDARSGRSHHCPNSRRDLCDDRLFQHCYPGKFRWWDFTIRSPNHDYTAIEPRWHSTISRMEKLSTEQQIFKSSEIAASDQPSPTVKPNAPREAAFPDTHWEINREVNRQVCPVDQDSTQAAYRKCNQEVDQMVNEADFKRRVNAEYRWSPAASYFHQSMRKHCTELRQCQHAST